MVIKEEMDSNRQPKILQDLCYLISSTQSFRIKSSTNNFTIGPQTINMHPTFTGIEDAYIYLREFEATRIATLTSRIEALEFEKHIQFNQVLAPMCTGCNVSDHIVEECPYLMSLNQNGFTWKSAFNERHMNKPYALTYNRG